MRRRRRRRARTGQLVEALLPHEAHALVVHVWQRPHDESAGRVAAQQQLTLALATTQDVRHHRRALQRLKRQKIVAYADAL